MDNLFLHHLDSLQVPNVPRTGGSAPCSPRATPPAGRSRTASVHTSRRVYSQRSIPSHRPTHARPDTCTRTHTSSTRTLDEEIRQILDRSSIERTDSRVRLLRRSHTLSPHVAGTLCLKNLSERSQRTGSDLRKYNSMDSTHGAWSDQPQQKRVPFKTRETEAFLLRRKHKTSPPCLSPSTDPPSTETSETGAFLKRRAPSFDSTLLQQSSDLPDSLLFAKPLPQPRLSIRLSIPCEQSNSRVPNEDQSSRCVPLDP